MKHMRTELITAIFCRKLISRNKDPKSFFFSIIRSHFHLSLAPRNTRLIGLLCIQIIFISPLTTKSTDSGFLRTATTVIFLLPPQAANWPKKRRLPWWDLWLNRLNTGLKSEDHKAAARNCKFQLCVCLFSPLFPRSYSFPLCDLSESLYLFVGLFFFSFRAAKLAILTTREMTGDHKFISCKIVGFILVFIYIYISVSLPVFTWAFVLSSSWMDEKKRARQRSTPRSWS